jgi:hypothetical protein
MIHKIDRWKNKEDGERRTRDIANSNWNAIIADCEYMKRLHVYVLVYSIFLDVIKTKITWIDL